MKTIICKGRNGLGNRMMVLGTAVELCRKYDVKLLIDWRDRAYSEQKAEAFSRFFFIKEELAADISTVSHTNVFPPGWKGRIFTPFNELANWKGKWREGGGAATGIDERYDTCVIGPTPSGTWDEKRVISIREAFRSFLGVKPDALETPKKFVAQKLSGHSIGVHIRWAAPQKRKRSISELLAGLDAAIERNRDAAIFVASDHAEPINILAERYRNIVTYKKWFPTGELSDRSETAMSMHRPGPHNDAIDRGIVYEEAVTEMLILSMCSQIIYQNNSSYGACAAALSNCDNSMISAWGENSAPVRQQTVFRKKYRRAIRSFRRFLRKAIRPA